MLEHFFVFLFWKYALFFFFFLAFEKRTRKRGKLHDLKVFIEVLLHKNLNFGQYREDYKPKSQRYMKKKATSFFFFFLVEER